MDADMITPPASPTMAPLLNLHLPPQEVLAPIIDEAIPQMLAFLLHFAPPGPTYPGDE